MTWTDALFGGGFALAGVTLQQTLTWHNDKRKSARDRIDRERQEQHLAFVELVKAARRVQRTLVDLNAASIAPDSSEALGREVDRLAEAVATIRLMVVEPDVIAAAEHVEDRAKELEGLKQPTELVLLQLTPLIETLQRYEGRR